MHILSLALWTLWESLSFFTFLHISSKKYASIYKPLWHRIHINTKRVFLAIISVCVLCAIIIDIYWQLLTTVTSGLFGLTFYKAKKSTRNSGNSGDIKQVAEWRKWESCGTFNDRVPIDFDLHVSFLCLMWNLDALYHVRVVVASILVLSLSIFIDPVLTPVMREDFWIKWKKTHNTPSEFEAIRNASKERVEQQV